MPPRPSGRQHDTGPVESGPGLERPAFRDAPDRDREDDEGEREIDEEDPAPRDVLNEPSAEHRADAPR